MNRRDFLQGVAGLLAFVGIKPSSVKAIQPVLPIKLETFPPVAVVKVTEADQEWGGWRGCLQTFDKDTCEWVDSDAEVFVESIGKPFDRELRLIARRDPTGKTSYPGAGEYNDPAGKPWYQADYIGAAREVCDAAGREFDGGKLDHTPLGKGLRR